MAEAFLKALAGDNFEAQSAGIEPGNLNPVVVEAMKEIGIDISRNKTKSIQSFIDQGVKFDYIITVCDEASAERCPVVPGAGRRLHIGFPDPSALKGSFEQKLSQTREIRDKIRAKVGQLAKEL
jgi:arsenate reductase